MTAYVEACAYLASTRKPKTYPVSASQLSIAGDLVTITALPPELRDLAMAIRETRKGIRSHRREGMK